MKKLNRKGTLRNVHKDAPHPSAVVTPAVVAAAYFNALRKSTFPADCKRDSLRDNELGTYLSIFILNLFYSYTK
jgi:hypothetical protein